MSNETLLETSVLYKNVLLSTNLAAPQVYYTPERCHQRRRASGILQFYLYIVHLRGFRYAKKQKTCTLVQVEVQFGRGGEIRTHGLLYPKQARYQAAPRPDIFTDIYTSATSNIIKQKKNFVNTFLLHLVQNLCRLRPS